MHTRSYNTVKQSMRYNNTKIRLSEVHSILLQKMKREQAADVRSEFPDASIIVMPM